MLIETHSGLSMDLLANNKKVIPIYFKNGDTWHSSIKLPDFALQNHSGEDTFFLKTISLTGIAGGKKVVTFHQDEGALQTAIGEASQLLNKLMRKPDNPWNQYNLHMLFGDVQRNSDPFEGTNRLEPNTKICLRLGELFSFHYAGGEVIDEILCQVVLTSRGTDLTIESPIILTPYKCKGNYIFPIQGSSTIVGTPWNCMMGHRMAVSQEFAFDVVDFRRDGNGGFVLSSPPNASHVGDYFLFEREVRAIGDGTVTASGNQWPNEWAENPKAYSEKRIIELTIKLLESGVEFNHAILGNYAIIDHHNGECSLYAHMSEGTVTVKPGDKVAQGQVIGRVGNTSNSDSPHLHFHLMDSPDFQTANGLPVTFTDLPVGQAPLCDLEESNSLLYSDYLFVNIPE